MITEANLLEYGFKKNEGDAAIFHPYEKEVCDDVSLCVTMQRNEPEFCILTPDGVLYLQIANLNELKIIEQSITGYEQH
ncbi:MAG: hypothetical protein GX227_10680 [Clostridiaceae bacterium]|nr:hypothetical protein [Clostridiaceae bacterium]